MHTAAIKAYDVEEATKKQAGNNTRVAVEIEPRPTKKALPTARRNGAWKHLAGLSINRV